MVDDIILKETLNALDGVVINEITGQINNFINFLTILNQFFL